MATKDQEAASVAVLKAVDALNKALEETNRLGVRMQIDPIPGYVTFIVNNVEAVENMMGAVARFEAEEVK